MLDPFIGSSRSPLGNVVGMAYGSDSAATLNTTGYFFATQQLLRLPPLERRTLLEFLTFLR